ncbi:MAG: 4-hydroxybenzoyl-CoA reductase subunit beta [Aquabacterium sp.]|nr:4-hydroxybenzoyl-CoA reductase subunit beta [Aquabacterium sp.]
MSLLPDLLTVRPGTLAEAVSALGQSGAQALGGGTDLLPNLRRGLGLPSALVDLTALPGLDGIAVAADGTLRIGALATLQAIATDAAVRGGWPALAAAASLVAGPTHRVAATLGGNLCQDTRCVFYNQSEWWRSGNGYCLKYMGDKCHVVVKSDRCYATYHGDVAPALMVMDAQLEIAGTGGTRRLPVAQLFQEDGAKRLTLAAGEMLVAVHVPPSGAWRAQYTKVRIREAVDFPLAGVAAALHREGDRIVGLRLAITGTNSAPLMVPLDALQGAAWDDAAATQLVQAVRKTCNVLATTIASVKYRRRVLLAVARQVVDDLWRAA